jgi:hypothetical protein
MLVSFKLGADPELMLRDTKTKKLRSAIPIIKEGKNEGRKLDATGENRILHDNVLVEFNTKPAESRDEFVKTIGSVLREGNKIVAKEGLELLLQASAEFPQEEISCQEACEFGCEPDFDAYELRINEMPTTAAQAPFRSAGGHLHLGKHQDKKVNELLIGGEGYGKVTVVKLLDIICGIPSVFIDKDPTAPARRGLYGKAGSHRPKEEYGVEYRAVGPWWLSSPEHTELAHRMADEALYLAINDQLEQLTKDLGGEEVIQQTINDSRVELAQRLFQKYIAPRLSKETAALIVELNATPTPNFYKAWKL